MSGPTPREGVTDLLRRVEKGDQHASDRLAEILHEAWLRIMPEASAGLEGRGHFMAIAARAMLQVLVEHARARRREKRGGDWQRVSRGDVPPGTNPEAALDELLDLHEAMDELARAYPRPARVLELRAFGGLTIEEVSEALGVAGSTVQADWLLAKAWLARSSRGRQA
jgi:RNA polymerase sigma factor (TIGR02999 family)